MSSVFISYSERDVDVATAISNDLRSIGVKVFMDLDTMSTSENYVQRITNAIRSCRCLIFVISENSLKSQWNRREVEYARQQKTTIIPVFINNNAFHGYGNHPWAVSALNQYQYLLWDDKGRDELLSFMTRMPQTTSRNERFDSSMIDRERVCSQKAYSHPAECASRSGCVSRIVYFFGLTLILSFLIYYPLAELH